MHFRQLTRRPSAISSNGILVFTELTVSRYISAVLSGPPSLSFCRIIPLNCVITSLQRGPGQECGVYYCRRGSPRLRSEIPLSHSDGRELQARQLSTKCACSLYTASRFLAPDLLRGGVDIHDSKWIPALTEGSPLSSKQVSIFSLEPSTTWRNSRY